MTTSILKNTVQSAKSGLDAFDLLSSLLFKLPTEQPATDENTIEPEGEDEEIETEKGTKVKTGFTVIEATKLIASHDETGNKNPDYPQELQPRDRARDTSQAQIVKMANNLKPFLLGATNVAYQGAPIIGKDRVVESGNGRAIAINLAYKLGKADKYREWLLKSADMYGISRSKIEHMKRPVLVRVRTSDVDRVQFAMEANQSDMLAMTATEKAKSDANRLNDSLMSRLSGDGDLNSLANRDFIMDFLRSLGESEAAQYSTTDGMPTKQLYDRAQAALFAKAYNDDRLLETMAESEKVEIANTIKALNQAAPHFIRARAISHKVTDGVTRQVGDAVELSLDDQAVNALIEATNVLKAAKNSGMSLEEYLKQTNVFGDDVDPVVAQMAIFIKENNRSSNRMGVAFQTMAEFVADELERRQNESLFVDDPEINLLDVLKAANARLKQQFGDEVKTIGGGTGGFIDIFTETRGQKADREAFLASQPHIDMLNAVINGDYDNETSEDLLNRIETAANAIDSTVNNDLISQAMDKWLEVDNKAYLLDSVNQSQGEIMLLTDNIKNSLSGLEAFAKLTVFFENIQVKKDERIRERARELGLEQSNTRDDGASESTNGGGRDGREHLSRWGKSTPEQQYADYGIQQSRGGFTAKPTADQIPKHLAGSLRPHQADAVNLALENYSKGFKSFVNADGTGAGKTRQQLALASIMSEKNNGFVLIITENDRIIEQAFKGDAQAMGIPIKKITSDAEIDGKGIYICTYHRVSSGDISKTPDFLICDEAHNLKNNSSRKTKAAKEMLKNTKNSALFSATPINVADEIGYIATAFGLSYSKLMDQLGYEYTEVARGVKGWKLKRGVSKKDALLKIGSMFESLTKNGVMVKREVSLSNMQVDGSKIPVDKEFIEKAEQDFDELEKKIQRLKATNPQKVGVEKMTGLQNLRRNLESQKIPYAIKSAKEELANGNQVVIFADRINDNEESEGTLLALSKAFDDAGIAHGKVFGKNLKNAKKEVEDFNNGKLKVIIATPQGGGTGLSMDDTVGDAPRVMIVLTAPFSAMGAVQMMGRINRLNTKSKSNVKFLRTNTRIDDWNYNIIEQKLATLGASVSGDLEKLNLSSADISKLSDEAISELGFDSAPISDNEPFEFVGSGFTQKEVESTVSAGKTIIDKPLANITQYTAYIPKDGGVWLDAKVGFGKMKGKLLSQLKSEDYGWFSWFMSQININPANVYFDGESKPENPVSNKRVYLKVPYDDKDYAKKYGAKWDGDNKKWYVIGDVPSQLERYILDSASFDDVLDGASTKLTKKSLIEHCQWAAKEYPDSNKRYFQSVEGYVENLIGSGVEKFRLSNGTWLSWEDIAYDYAPLTGKKNKKVLDDTSGIVGWFDSTNDKGWIGVDLDGTLAQAGDWKGVQHIGKPVIEMLVRVKSWVNSGKTVKIMTARAADKNAIPYIKDWLSKYGLGDLEITNKKDLNMIALWDDRAVNVEKNTGKPTHDVLDSVLPTQNIVGWFDNSEVA